jgi:hypothetical protein
VVPVFGGERFLRPSRRAPQGVAASNLKFFLPSTNYPQFSGSYPPVWLGFSTGTPQIGRGQVLGLIFYPAVPHKTWQAQFETGRAQQETAQ